MNDKGGQLPVIFALVLSTIIIVSALLAYRMLIFPKEVEESDWRYVIFNADGDFPRMLSVSLANFTQEYRLTNNLTLSENKAKTKLEYWKLAFILGHGGLGLRLNITPASEDVEIVSASSYKIRLVYDGDVVEKDVYIPSLLITEGHFFNCSWNNAFGLSVAYASISLDAIKYGFYGWKNYYISFLAVNITAVESTSSETFINFTCFNDEGWVNYLNNESISIYINDLQGNLSDLEYWGAGRYVAYINQTLPSNYVLKLTIRDRRDIHVTALLNETAS